MNIYCNEDSPIKKKKEKVIQDLKKKCGISNYLYNLRVTFIVALNLINLYLNLGHKLCLKLPKLFTFCWLFLLIFCQSLL